MSEIKLDEQVMMSLVEATAVPDAVTTVEASATIGSDIVSSEVHSSVHAEQTGAASENAKIIDKRYELISLLGVGGMSKVFKAKDLLSQSAVAIKLITPERMRDPKSLERLAQEAKLVSMLSHSNIAPLKEYGHDQDGTPYLVMEYIEGTTLSELLRQEGTIAPDRAIQIMLQVCEGLKQAHANGIIHRDLKPSNIILSQNGATEKAQILDFGIARILEQTNSAHVPMTETSEMLGTPWYMSPEACFGQIADQRSDIYQLGCIFCELLTGRKAFGGINAFEVMYKHVTGSPELDDLHGDMKTIADRALSKNPAQRHQSMDELKQDLKVALSNYQQNKNEHRDKKRFSDFMSASNDSLNSLLPRRLGAAAIDAVAITGLFVPVAVILSAYLTQQYTDGTGMPKLYYIAIDACRLGILDSFLVWPATLLTLVPDQALFWSGGLAEHFSFLNLFRFECKLAAPTLILLNWLYHALFESSRLGATPGKIICKLGVRTGIAQSVSFWKASQRHFAKNLSMFFFLPGLIRFVIALKKNGVKTANVQLASQLRTPLHDLLSKCGVKVASVKARKATAISFAVVSCMSALMLLPWVAISFSQYDLALKVNPNFQVAREMRAEANINHSKFREALADLNELEKALPTESRIYSKEAMVLCQLGQFDAAAAKIREAIKNCRDPKDDSQTKRIQYELKSQLARILATSCGKYKEALAALDQVPSRFVDAITRAYLYKLTGNSAEAVTQFKFADDYWLSRPGSFASGYEHRRPFIYQNRAIALSELGKTREALAQNERAISDFNFLKSHRDGHGGAQSYIGGSAYLLHGHLTLQLGGSKAIAEANFHRAIELFTDCFRSRSGFNSLNQMEETGKAYAGRADAYAQLGETAPAQSDREMARKLGVMFNYQCNIDEWW